MSWSVYEGLLADTKVCWCLVRGQAHLWLTLFKEHPWRTLHLQGLDAAEPFRCIFCLGKLLGRILPSIWLFLVSECVSRLLILTSVLFSLWLWRMCSVWAFVVVCFFFNYRREVSPKDTFRWEVSFI